MTPKERLLAAIRGQEVDRVPWAPFLAYWWEAQSHEFQAQGQLEFLSSIGADPLLRGVTTPYRMLSSVGEWSSHESAGLRNSELKVGKRTLTTTSRYSPRGDTWFVVEHPLKCEEDWKAFLLHLESGGVEPAPGAADAAIADCGDRGLVTALVGAGAKTGFQSLAEHWAGTVGLTYALADYPETVEAVVREMRRLDIATAEAALECKAEAFIFWEDSSTLNVPPAWFERYTAPTIAEWGRILHADGRLLIHHACGSMRDLLRLEKDLPVDALESLSPPPTGDVELWEAREAMGERIALIGGIEPTVFLNATEAELAAYVTDLLARMGRRSFVLANSDSCPPGVSLAKFRLVTELVRKWGL